MDYKKITRWRVQLNTLFFILAIFFSKYDGKSFFWGLFIALTGEFIRLWAAGEIQKNKTLTTRGVYSIVRHPLYIGSFFIALGVGIAGKCWLLLAIYLPVFILMHTLSIRLEDKLLENTFGSKFTQYRKEVRAVIPRITGVFRFKRGKWLFSRAVLNREHLTLYAIFSYFIILLMKGFLSKF